MPLNLLPFVHALASSATGAKLHVAASANEWTTEASFSFGKPYSMEAFVGLDDPDTGTFALVIKTSAGRPESNPGIENH